jgi:uncharacterized protein
MGEVTRYPNGTFCWVDLGTTDVAGAKAFYGRLLGWETEDVPDVSGTYTLCRLDGKDAAGIHEHSPDEGVGWSSYISVDDVDASTTRARQLGGTVATEPLEVTAASRMSVIRDPSGAEVCLWQPKGHIGARLVNDIGAWTWNELVTPELQMAKEFYAEMFGWSTEDPPSPIPRSTFTMGGLLIGGMHTPQPGEGDEPRWTVSFTVADADKSAAVAEQLGGAILLPPMPAGDPETAVAIDHAPAPDIPIGRFAIVADPAGAAFTIAAFPGGPARGVDGS